MSRKPSPEEELASMARLLAHPIRVKILDLLREADASPSDLTPRIGESLGTVAYHFKLLADQGALKLVSTQQVRGALEHTYAISTQARKDLDGLGEWLDKRRRKRPAAKKQARPRARRQSA